MSAKRPYRGPSESQSQANAEALANRGRTYADDNAKSFRLSWDARHRAPRDLRHAVTLVRRAYADEIPSRLHGADLADDGTPKMTQQAENLIFGSPTWTDAGKGDAPILSFYLTPFRATLDGMEHHAAESVRKRAAIVRHVTIGSQEPEQAALTEGVPSWCSRMVAMDALTAFLRLLSDVRVDVANEVAAA